MLWRKKKNREDRMPWYRRRDYKGNLTEKRKERIDHFRWLAQQPGGKHPADSDLPEEVVLYISKLQVDFTTRAGRFSWGRFSS